MSFKSGLFSQQLEGHKVLKLVPLVIRYAAGVPSIVSNPTGASVTVADTGTGNPTLTFANAAIAPMMAWVEVLPAAAGTLGLVANLNAAPTTTVVDILVNSGADGATETDPVDLHVLVIRMEIGA